MNKVIMIPTIMATLASINAAARQPDRRPHMVPGSVLDVCEWVCETICLRGINKKGKVARA
jgi:hypothetical protein